MNCLKSNKFGTGFIFSGDVIQGNIYITSASCMSVFAESLGWANTNFNRIVDNPEKADCIIVLSCQVTDLAILNDFKTIENLQKKYPGKQYYIGGCLAQRFDIKLPSGVVRLDHLRSDYQELKRLDLINYEKPFWVPEFKDSDREFANGHLFRNMYPLRVGAGCHGNCKYCTIKITRGAAYNLIPEKLRKEFIKHDDILIVADSVCPEQIEAFANMAKKYDKVISFRNVEPQNVVAAKEILFNLAEVGLLRILHTPVQATKEKALVIMNRDVDFTKQAIQISKAIQIYGVFTATNIIIDYDGIENDFEGLEEAFNYISWNPYWDGNWNREKAEERWNHYINKKEEK